MTFPRRRSYLVYNYYIKNELLFRTTDSSKDFGIYFDNHLEFNFHINRVANKSLKILDFIFRNCSDLSKKMPLHLYKYLFRSTLEY